MKRHLLAAGVLIVASFTSTAATAARPVLPFIEDDYGQALIEARGKKLPIFAEAWAPW